MLEGKKVPASPEQRKTQRFTRNNTRNFKARRTNPVSSRCSVIGPTPRFSLQLEHCTPGPVPGPLTSPILGGLPANSPLTGGPAASFRLAQLKAQLALAHMNYVFAVGSPAATLTANSNTPLSRLPSTPPSPTAVAINLLNLLKIANSMSHPLFNPFLSGKQSSSQGQYGLSGGQTERDPRTVMSHLSAGTSFSSSGMPSFTPGTPAGPLMTPLGLQGNYRPDRGRMTVDEDIERCLDLNIGRAREEVRLQSANQSAHFISNQRDQFPSSSTGMSSYLTSSVSQGPKPTSVDSDSRSLDWLPICKRAAENDSSKMHSSASASFVGSGGGRFNTASERKCDVQSIPGLGDYDNPMLAKFMLPHESNRPKYTSESASNILLHFGLEKEDLEQLICYPEDQITPENLPYILRQIRVDKEKRTSTVDKSEPYSKPQPITTVSGIKKLAPTSSRGTVPNQDEIPSLVLKPSKVIDYGHTGKYTAGPGNEHGTSVSSTAKVGGSGSTLYTDTFKNSSHSREVLTKSTAEMKSGSFVSSHGQMSSVTTFSSMRSSMAPPSIGPVARVEVQPNQTSPFASFSVPNKDTNLRHLSSEVSKSLPLKQPEPDRQSSAKPQPSCTLFRGVHPGRPGLVLIGSNDQAQKSNQNTSKVQASKVSGQVKKQQGQRQVKQQPKQPAKQGQQPLQPRGTSTMKPGPLSSSVPAPPQLIPSIMSGQHRMSTPASKGQFAAKKGASKRLPKPDMVRDYAAATPKLLPHTCCLCMKDCATIKDWLVHQNTSLHLENCKLLRIRFPDWDGETLELLRAPSKDANRLPSASGPTPHHQRRLEETRERRVSRSRSRSPHRHHKSEDRRQRRSSHSRSPNRHHASESRRQRRSSRSRSPQSSQQSRRSRPRSLSPRHRSRSRSFERRSSPRRREDKRSPLRRSREHRESPRRSDDRRSPPSRRNARRSSADGELPQRRSSRSAERLARRLLETPAVQSLSKQSDLETMVKTLAPALLAELSKMTSSSQSPMTVPASSAAKVRIRAKHGSLYRHDVTAAMETYGKIKSVVLFRSAKEAIICFEKEEDANKLKTLESFDINGVPVSLVKEGSTVAKTTPSTKEQKAAPAQISAKANTSKASKFSSAANVKPPATSRPKNTTNKLSKAKLLVSKSKSISTKQVAKTMKSGKGVAVSQMGKEKTSVALNSKSSETSPKDDKIPKRDTKLTKQKAALKKPKSGADTSAVAPNETVKVKEESEHITMDKTDTDSASKAEMPEQEAGLKAVKKENVTETDAENNNLSSESAALENQPGAAGSEGQESPLVHKDSTIGDETKEASAPAKYQLKESIKVEPENTEGAEPETTEPMKVESSVESKDQNVMEKEAENDPATTEVQTSPCTSQSSAEPPQRPQTTIQADVTMTNMTSQVLPTASAHSESAAEEIRMETDALEEKERKAKAIKQEVQVPEVRACHEQEPEPVSNISAGSPEAAASKPKPADEAESLQQAATTELCAPDGTAPLVKVKMEATEETGFVQLQTETAPASASVAFTNNGEQPPPQDSTSVPPVSSAGSTLSDAVKEGSTDTDMKETEKPKVEISEDVTISPKALVKQDQSPRTAVSPSDKHTILAPSKATVSVIDAVESDIEFPHINEDIFKAFTTALREHKQKKKSTMHHEEKESTTISKTTFESVKEKNTQNTKEDITDVDTSSDIFDESDFNFEDFVTVDEISEDPEDTAEDDGSSSSKLTSKEKTERQSSEVTSPAKKTLPETSKICKSSTSAASSSTATSSSSSKSVKTCVSPGKKAQQSKTKSAAGGSKTSPQGRSTRSSAAAVKASVETCQLHKKVDKPREGAVVQFDHRVSAKSSAAKTVESESKMETEMDPPAHRESLEPTHQTQRPEMESKSEIPEEVKTSKEKEVHMEEDGKSTEGREGFENFEIIDSLEEPTDDKMITDDSIAETQELNPKEDQISHQECLQISAGAENNDKANQEACIEKETDPSIQEEDKQAATPDKDGVSMVTEDKTQVAHSSDKSLVEDEAHKTQVLDLDTNQILISTGDGPTGKQKEEIFSEELCQTSKDSDQISEDTHHPGSSDGKDTQQEVFENSAGDQTLTKNEGQGVEGPSDETSPIEEDDVYQVIDSLEDQSTETELETDKKKQTKKGSEISSIDDRPTRSSRSKTSKSEDKGKTQKKQNTPVRKYETRVKDSMTKNEEKMDEDTEEMVFEIVDSIEDESVQEASTTKGSGRRLSSRRHKEADKSEEEMVYQILDSVGEETDSEKPAGTRSTRGRKEKTTEKSTESEKSKKEKTPTRRRQTPARDSHEKDRGKSPKTNVPQKGNAPTKKSDAVGDKSKEMTFEIIDAVEEEAENKPATQKSRRGRPKKDAKPSEKQTAALKEVDLRSKVAEDTEATTYQILDSIEDETVDEQATKVQTKNARKSSSKNDDGTTKKRTRSSKRKEEEEPVYQIVDSLEEEQVTETSLVQEDKRAANVDSIPPVETSKAASVKHESLLQEVGERPMGSTPDMELKKQEESDSAKSQKTSQRSPKEKDATSSRNAIGSLDEVSDEEDDYPDDTAEKEEIKKIQAAFKEREDEQKEKRTREKGTRERRSRGSGGSAKTKEMWQEKEEAESQELVTLDEVGVDEKETTNSPKCDRELMEGELQELVTLDEIDEEEEEQQTPVVQPLSQEVQSGESFKTLDEAALGENKEADKEDSEETSSSVKRKHDDNTEESEDFVTVDEVGTTEEEDKKTTASTKCRPRKRSRRTPVRKSTRGKTDEEEEENEKLPPAAVHPPSTQDKDLSAPSGELETQKMEVQTETVSTESQQRSESPAGQKPEACVEEKGKDENEAEVTVDNQLQKLTEPEAKRSRSQSPSLPVDFKLPPFNPKSPLGQEFVVPKSGFFCNLCSIFYLKESTAKETHCSSQKHYSNLLKHYQMLQQKMAKSSASSQGSVSN